MELKELLEKYDIPTPRYTSYPTVPYWDRTPTEEEWLEILNHTFSKKDSTWALYLHIPFCESLCTYCGCNTIITKSHNREDHYIDLIEAEWNKYLKKVSGVSTKPLKQIHIGGGTPTFLSPESLRRLLKFIFDKVKVDKNQLEASIEVDPRRTSEAQLKVLQEFGFKRISLGVQDFNHEVQRLVNRIQPFEMTKKLTDTSRSLGFNSVNFDLIYGLPKQDLECIKFTAEKTLELRPDRIALYSLAVVPWIKPAQRLFKDEDLPRGAKKRALYDEARKILLGGGYVEIGMDHFALPSDSLSISYQNGNLHRNFMGYSDYRTDVMLGLGVSSISETPTCFHQNEKVFPVYDRKISAGEIPTLRGHILSEQDQSYREQILTFMTQLQVELKDKSQENDLKEFLSSLIEDDLIVFEDGKMKMKEGGRPFLRNACLGLDQRMRAKKPGAKVFSQSM